MKPARAALVMALALMPSLVSAAEEEPCGAGRPASRHLYAFGYFYNSAANAAAARVVGNAFAVHAVTLAQCSFDAVCDTGGRSKWRLLFATAAHVIKDVCLLQQNNPPGTIKLVIPARPHRLDRGTQRIDVTAQFCALNAEAANYSNDLFTVARDEGRATNAATLGSDDLRKNSDQWFFTETIEISDREIVLPVMIGPLRKPRKLSNGIPLRYNAFQNAPADKSQRIEEGVWWTEATRDYAFTNDMLSSVYEAEDWTTLKGASGSPVLELVGSGNQVRAIGITTRFAFVGCAKAAGASRTAVSETEFPSDAAMTAMTVDDLARCLNDPATGQRAAGKQTSFIPVLRFPPQLLAQFVRLGAGTAGPAPTSWTRSPELLGALRALMRSRREARSEEAREEISDAIKLLANDIPAHEFTFLLSVMAEPKLAGAAITPDDLSISGCRRIEPLIGGAR